MSIELEEGRRSEAVERTLDLLDIAAADGHRRAFLDLGRPVDQLLRAALRARPSADLQALVAAGNLRPHAAAGLSERELDVVRYLPTALSNAEIATQLYISLNTLKSHLASIYRKLGASDRREASRRAEELGLA